MSSAVEKTPHSPVPSERIGDKPRMANELDSSPNPSQVHLRWYRSTFYNAIILGVCNFCAPGIWGAMNSLGGGGEESPWLVDGANALTFCLMIITCASSSVFVRYIDIRWTLILGAAGYCPYAAGLDCNNRFGSRWFVLFGAACCGLGTGLFWMAEAAIALSYPEPHNQGRFLGLWLSFRVGGQILGGAVNLGLNVHRNKAGSVSYAVYLVFIALQALAPFAGLLLSPPSKVQRTDSVKVSCGIPKTQSVLDELAATARLFLGKRFLSVVPLITQAVFAEAVFFTYEGLWFTVRTRALGSLLSGIVAIIAGNVLGAFLDRPTLSLKTRSRWAFAIILALQGAWWLWGTIIVTRFRQTRPVYDWVDDGFGNAFAWFLLQVGGFQLNYMYLEVVRYAGLLRGSESAAQAVSYGLSSVTIMGEVGCVYLNFGLWAIAMWPAWYVVKDIGVTLRNRKTARERGQLIERDEKI